MRLSDFHCDEFSFSFTVDREALDEAGLASFVGRTPSKPRWSFDSADASGAQHSHVSIDFRKKDFAKIRVSFHDAKIELANPDSAPSVMEACVGWIGQFVPDEPVLIHGHSYYAFDTKQFASALPLPFPVMSLSPDFHGCQVTGLGLKLTKDFEFNAAVLQRFDAKMTLMTYIDTTVDLRQFDLWRTLKALSKSVERLILPLGAER